ncbi:glycosyltransferase [Candidatus Bathyarchaeota archaeon]|nr:glycosyltransferase [Candidatus Bathyarchaeota archaeon]
MGQKPLVSVIIPTYNKKQELIRLVESLKQSDYPPENIEFIIVDDASTDGTYDAIKTRFPDLKVVRNNSRRMTSGARNIGIKFSRGDYLLFVDHDNVVDRAMISELVNLMERNRNVGLAGPVMYYYSDPKRIWCAGGKLGKPFYISKYILQDSLSQTLGEGTEVQARECEYIPNAFIVRRQVIEEIGFFDERNFPILWEDADFSLRVKHKGYKIVIVTAAKIWHDVPTEKDFHINEERAYFRGRNRSLFYLKYAPLRTLLLPLDFVGFCYVLAAYDKDVGKRKKLLQYFKGIIHGISFKIASRSKHTCKSNILLSTIKNSSKRAILSLTLFSVIYTMLSYRGNNLTIGGDYFIPFHATKYLERFLHSSNLWGGSNTTLPPIFFLPTLPNTLLFSLFSILGVDIYFANKIYVFVLVVSSAIAIYYLSTTVFHKDKHKHLIGLASALAYLYNPWIIADGISTMVFIELSLVQTGFVFFLSFTMRYFQTREIRYSLYSGLASFLMLSVIGSGAYRMTLLASAGFVIIALYYSVLRRKTGIKDIVVGVSILALISFVLNSYLIIPFIQNRTIYISLVESHPASSFFNNFSVLINTLRLLNYWAFYSGYVVYANIYFNNPIVLVSTFAWPIFAFAPLLWKEVRKSSKCFVIYLTTLVAITFACGSNPPLGPLYNTIIHSNIGGIYFLKPFYITREVTAQVLTILYALLIGLFSILIYRKLTETNGKLFHVEKRKKIIATMGVALIFVPLLVSAWPALTGDVMRNWYDPTQYGVRIPQRYWNANSYLEGTCDLNHKALLLPPTEVYIGLSWGFYGAAQFYSLMFNVPLITGNELPYNVGQNRTLLNQVYSVPYIITEDEPISTKIKNITAYHGDQVRLFENYTLQIAFNKTIQPNTWHDIELQLANNETWSPYTHIFIEIDGNFKTENLQIKMTNTQNSLEYLASSYAYQTINQTLVPLQPETQNNQTTIVLLPSLNSNHTQFNSIWIRYLIDDATTPSTITIHKLSKAKITLDTYYYATILANNSIKYIIIDQSIKEGAKTNPTFWLNAINSSTQFTLLWHNETLYIFENVLAK